MQYDHLVRVSIMIPFFRSVFHTDLYDQTRCCRLAPNTRACEPHLISSQLSCTFTYGKGESLPASSSCQVAIVLVAIMYEEIVRYR